jgi:hypothetical protein
MAPAPSRIVSSYGGALVFGIKMTFMPVFRNDGLKFARMTSLKVRRNEDFKFVEVAG